MSKQKNKKEKSKHIVYKSFRFIYGYLISLYPSAIVYMIISIAAQTAGMLLKTVIPAAAVGILEEGLGLTQLFIRMGALIAVFSLVNSISSWYQFKYNICVLRARGYNAMLRIMDKMLTTDYINAESNDKRKLVGKALYALDGSGDIEKMYNRFPQIVIHTLMLLMFGSIIFLIDYRIVIVMAVMLVFNILLNNYARRYMMARDEENTEIWRKQNYLYSLTSDIRGGKDVRIYHMEKWLGGIYGKYIREGNRWQRAVEKRWYLPVFSDTVFIALRDGLTYIFLIYMAFEGEISLAEFTLMIGAVSSFSDYLFGIVNDITEFVTAAHRVPYYMEVLDMKDELHHEGGIRIAEDFNEAPEIELRNVSFSYNAGEADEKQIFKGLNLKIRAGEKLALVGSNGAGKTTFVKLLCGFYQPTEGEVLVNGVSVRDYNIEDYYRIIGAVFQDEDGTSFTLANIVSGREKSETDMERFWNAVEQAGLKEKIMSLDKKEDTYIGIIFDNEGIQLSGGEKQKLMLARCLYKNAPVMILDEPTAALDPIAESRMYEEYNKMADGKTTVFISHRLASTRFCDRIIFLDNGEIAEMGTHEELMAGNGKYADIYNIQSHYYREEMG